MHEITDPLLQVLRLPTYVDGRLLVVLCALVIVVSAWAFLFDLMRTRVTYNRTNIGHISLMFTVMAVVISLLAILHPHSQIDTSDLTTGAMILVPGLVLAIGWFIWGNALLRRPGRDARESAGPRPRP